MQYCFLHHGTLLQSPVTSTTGCCFCFGSISSFFLELVLHCSPVAYWHLPTWGVHLSVSYLFAFSYSSFHTLKARILKWFAISCPTKCPCSKPPLTNTFTGDTWTLMESLGQSSCGVTAPFSWVLMHTRFCLCPPRVCLSPQSCISSGALLWG